MERGDAQVSESAALMGAEEGASGVAGEGGPAVGWAPHAALRRRTRPLAVAVAAVAATAIALFGLAVSHPRMRRAGASALVSTQGKYMDAGMAAILARHNHYRCMHGVPAMEWDDAIAANAQAWAQETGGVMRHSPPYRRRGIAGFRNVGENLLIGDTSARAVDSWYDEIRLTSGGRIGRFTPATGHYTQIVWEDSVKLGCGLYRGLLVCQYGPAGNFIGQFATKVKPPTVPAAQCPDSGAPAAGPGSPSGAPGAPGARPGTPAAPVASPGGGGGGAAGGGLEGLGGQSRVDCGSICASTGKGSMLRWAMNGRGSTTNWRCTCTSGAVAITCEGRPFTACSFAA